MNPWHEKIALNTGQPHRIIVSTVENGFPVHWHQELEIVYVLEGRMRIGINDELYALEPGDVLFIGSCELHHYEPNPQGCHKMILQLGITAFDAFSDLIFGQRILTPHLRASAGDGGGPSASGEEEALRNAVERHFAAIHEEWRGREIGHELVLKARTSEIAALVVRRLPMEPYSAQERTKRLEQLDRLNKVLKYIETEYAGDLSLGSAADIAGFSPTYFSRFFKEATGTTFVDYVNAFRANVARLMLADGDDSVTGIAYRAGFNSIETFNRVFKKIHGRAPSSFRHKK
ncbi:helix-turn-helix domain-containing protein [Cohnella cellulosilytica]|uniref:Helix-turn-helix domain-containing protein n=1 Tax=Cohnella cellulosilytica TaxID=986710 RepID=A0ABW2FNM4_9BACL